MNTWSWESMQTPPIPPVTQRFGNGLGHEGSTSNFGALPCARKGARHKSPSAAATPADVTAIRTKLVLVFFFIFYLFQNQTQKTCLKVLNLSCFRRLPQE